MSRKEITATGVFTFLPGLLAIFVGIAALSDSSPYRLPLTVAGVALVLVGLTALGYLWRTAPKGEKEAAMGDSYNNSGVNYGHMGPINIGRQQFQLTQAHLDQIIANAPKGRSVVIEAVGGNQANHMGQAIEGALQQAGFTVAEFNMIGVQSPPPANPLELFARGETTVVRVAPNA